MLSRSFRSHSAVSLLFSHEFLESRRLLSTSIWSTSTPLPSGRGDATAVSNANGIELFGGSTGGTNSSSSVVELAPANNLATTRLAPLITSLTGLGVEETGVPVDTGDGSIGDWIVYGGSNAGKPTAATYAYADNTNLNPVTEAPMSIPRAYFAHAVDPATGDVYAIGGLTTSNVTVASAEVYDPNTGAWSAIAPLPVALSQAAGTTDGAGQLFVFGGMTSAGTPVATVYRYTIATNTWDAMATMSAAIADTTAIYGFYGSIYVAGGKSTGGAVNLFSLYNPVLNTWTTLAPLPSPVYGAAGVVDYNSNLDLIGGFGSGGAAVTTVLSTPVAASTTAMPQPPSIAVGDYYTDFNGTPQGVTAMVVGSDGVTLVNGSVTYTYNGSTTVPVNAGTYKVIARFTSADPGYVNGAADGLLTISAVSPTLRISGNGSFTYNGQPHALSGVAVGVDGVTPVAGTFSFTYNNSSVAPTSWGTYSTVATFTPSDTNYISASTTGTITIPDPRIVTGVTVTGTSATSLTVSWNPVVLPSGATPTYNVYEEIYHNGTHGGKGSGGTPGYWTPVLVGSGITSTSLLISGLAPATATTGQHDYVVTSVDGSSSPPAESTASSPYAVGSPDYGPSLSFAMLNGALVSQASVEVNHTVQILPVNYGGGGGSSFGNPSGVFTLAGAPSTMTVDPATGVVTYSPLQGESGSINILLVCTNPFGSSSIPFTFNVAQQPTVIVTGGSFAYDGQTHSASAVAVDAATGQPVTGTFSFAYAPSQDPTSFSSSPYSQVGSYIVQATFISSNAAYGTATGTGTQTITQSGFQTIAFPGPDGWLSVDSTGTILNAWGDYASGGQTFTEQIPISSYTELSISGSYQGTRLSIDLTNGDLIPVDGIVYSGGGYITANAVAVTDYSGGSDTVVADNGQLDVNGRVIGYSLTGQVSFASSSTTALTVNSGTLHLPATAGVQNFSSIAIGSGASLIADSPVSQSTRTVIDTGALSIAGSAGAWTGTLDLRSNDLVLNNPDAASAQGAWAALSSQLASGFAGGWTGAGIDSSAAAGDVTYLTALGLMRGRAATTFDGIAVNSNSLLIKYTYYGDTNLDGQVDGSDYSRIDSGYLTGATGWENGDLNYDGSVNGTDYTLIDNAYNTQGASLAASIAGTAKTPSAVTVFSGQSPIILVGSSADDILVMKKDKLDLLGIV